MATTINPVQPVQVIAGRFQSRGNHAFGFKKQSLLPNTVYETDLSTMKNFSASIQSIYFDNSANTAFVIFTVEDTGQIIYLPPGYSGYVDLVAGTGLRFNWVSQTASLFSIFLLDYPHATTLWAAAGGGGLPISGGNVLVSDAILDSTVSGGMINVSSNLAAAGQNQNTIIGAADVIVQAAGIYTKQTTYFNNSAAGQIINLNYGAAATLANGFPLNPGASWNAAFGATNALHAIASAAGAILSQIGA